MAMASHTKLRYNADGFPHYFKQLRARCLRSKGGWILGRLVNDPIAKYVTTNKKYFPSATDSSELKALIAATDEAKINGDEDGGEILARAEAMANITRKMQMITPTSADLQKDPQNVAFDFHFQVEKQAADTGEAIELLRADLQQWLHAEATIYSIAVETLSDAPQFIIDEEGAGREQLAHLMRTHQTSNKATTRTLK